MAGERVNWGLYLGISLKGKCSDWEKELWSQAAVSDSTQPLTSSAILGKLTFLWLSFFSQDSNSTYLIKIIVRIKWDIARYVPLSVQCRLAVFIITTTRSY